MQDETGIMTRVQDSRVGETGVDLAWLTVMDRNE